MFAMKKISVLSAAATVAWASLAFEFQLERDIPYYTPEELVREGSNAVARCKLDVTWPTGVTNFATVVNFHGGGLVHTPATLPARRTASTATIPC